MATAPARAKPKSSREATSIGYAPLMPRFWHGMSAGVWFKLLARNRFAISPARLPAAVSISAFSLFNSSMRLLQELMFGRAAEAAKIERPPIFIVGHWRTGTTLLHELLVLDKRHGFPTTYQCFAPNHFLVTESLVTRWFKFLLPSQRPMDNMITGWDRPQEDEFALCNLGVPSPYLTMAFPNRGPAFPEYLDLDLPAEEVARWQAALVWFLKRVTYGDGRRIVLKSPPHTARIKALLEAFPDARFVHIARNPYAIFPSTVRLWKSLNYMQGLQVSRDRGLDEYVLSSFERMYRAYERDRALVPPGQLYELRYEELVDDMVGEMARLYEALDLGDFDAVRPRLVEYVEGNKNYRTNQHQLSPEMHAAITSRWASYIQRFGYAE